MKKLFATLAVAGLTVAAFAQTPAPSLTFSGSLDFGALASQVSGAAWRMKSFDPVNSTQGRLNLNAKYDGGSFGWYIRGREQDNWTAGNSGSFALRRAYAWLDLASGAVRVSVGRLNTQSWATGSFGGNWEDIGAIDGLVGSTVEIKAVENLNFGAYIPFNTTSDAAGNLLRLAQWSGSYKIPGTGDVQAGVSLGAYDHSGTAIHNGYYYVGAAYTADKNLTANVTYLAGYPGNNATVKLGFNYLSEKVGYNFNDVAGVPVTASLIASQQLYAESNYGMALYFNPQAEYAYDIYGFGLSSVILYDTAKVTGSQKKYGYEVDPYVKATVAKGVSIKWFVGFTSGKDTLGNGEQYIGGTAPGFRDPSAATGNVGSSTTTTAGTATIPNAQSARKSTTGQTWGTLADSTVKTGVSVSVSF